MIDITGGKRRSQPRALQNERLQQRHAVAPAAECQQKHGGAVIRLPAPEGRIVEEEHDILR